MPGASPPQKLSNNVWMTIIGQCVLANLTKYRKCDIYIYICGVWAHTGYATAKNTSKKSIRSNHIRQNRKCSFKTQDLFCLVYSFLTFVELYQSYKTAKICTANIPYSGLLQRNEQHETLVLIPKTNSSQLSNLLKFYRLYNKFRLRFFPTKMATILSRFSIQWNIGHDLSMVYSLCLRD